MATKYLFCFIILSGFCWSFGNNQLKNGVSVIFWSFVVSIVSIIIDQPIYFGVLTCIGSCILITLLCNKFLKKINPIIGMVVCLALFLFTREVKSGYFGFYSVKLFDAPSFLYKDFVTAYFGFPPLKFTSFDYYPILPWIFLYWFGYFLYYLFKKYNWFKVLSKISFKPLEIIGRKSLHIYVVHQVVIFALLYVLFLFIR